MKIRLTKIVMILTMVMVLTVHAWAWESYANGWDGTVDNDWATDGNWSKGYIPTYADDLITQVAGGSSGFVVQSGTDGGFHKLQVGMTTDGLGVATVQMGASLTGRWYILVGHAEGTNGSFTNNGMVTVEDWVGVGITGVGLFNNGGSLSITNILTIGTNALGYGTFTNSGTLTTGGNLVIGQSGTGVFNCNDGTVNIGGSVSLPGSVGYGIFNLNGGTVNVAGVTGVNIGGTSGIFNMYDGVLKVDTRLNMWSEGAEFNLYGGQAIFESIEHSRFVIYGDIDITGGALYIAGDLTGDANLLGYIRDGLIYTSTVGNVIEVTTEEIGGQMYTKLISVYGLWSGYEIPSNDDMGYVEGVEHVRVYTAEEGVYQFLHGVAIVRHKDVFYANWAAGPVDEHSLDECVRGSRSYDGGLTWSAPEMVAPPLDGDSSNSHGVYFSDGNNLWFFAAARHLEGTVEINTTEAYLLNETTDTWDSQAVVSRVFTPFDEPQQMSNGKWIVGGSSVPKIAIFDGSNPLETWTVVRLPVPSGVSYLWPETSLWVDGSEITAISRNSFADRALISFSKDCGLTWTTVAETNLPLAASKPFGGTLSSGQRYLVYNTPSEWPGRTTLAIAVSKPCSKKLCRVWKIRHGEPEQPLYEGFGKFPQYSYPYAIEFEDKLYVIYSVGKEDCDLSIIPLESLYIRPDHFSDVNHDCMIDFMDFSEMASDWLLEIE